MDLEVTFEKKLRLALLVTSILTVVLGLLTWKVVADADGAAQWVRHTNKVLDDIAIAREATIEIESMTRGYMVYGDKIMLANRDAVAKRRTEAIAHIEKDTADNPKEQARIPVLRKAALDRRALADQLIALRETQGFEAARSFGGGANTEQTRNAYLAVLEEMDGEERNLLKQRDVEHAQARSNAVTMGMLTALVMLGTLITAFLMINRHARSIAAARNKLQESNCSLQVAKDAAEHANASKDTFLATMSHEIRTPMSGLLGMLELLALSKLNSEQAETLAVARDSGHALGRIIDDILDHAKIKAGKLAITPEPISLDHLLQRNINTYFAVASRKGLTLRQVVDPRISPALLADPLRLLQVLGNLVSNAIKFTEQGYVEVRAELVGRADGKEMVCLSVKDTGIGMSPEVQARVFQPFEQAGMDTERLYGGTGLGLAISRRLAQMMGSDIVVESTPGIGTTMRVTLELTVTDAQPIQRLASASVQPLWQQADQPMVEVAPAPLSALVAGAASAPGPWVLAVDDNPTNRLLIARQLAALGMQVQTAAHGQEALYMWRASKFVLVITDCNMPEMDGYAFTRAVRDAEAKQGRARTPVLGWTANALPNTLSDCQAAGMDDVLTKPSELRQLRALLAKWLPNLAAVPLGPAPVAVNATVLNLTLLKEVCGNSPEMLREFTQTIRESFQTQIPELTNALESQQMQAIGLAGHKLKSSAGIIGAQSLLALCARIETAASSGDAAELPKLKHLFSHEAQRVVDALAALDTA
jgi:signal transduction histidine kinase/HPt (histidine-containing phosphotransfer) domain-containing protein/ActR/RegA family two-component response regulator